MLDKILAKIVGRADAGPTERDDDPIHPAVGTASIPLPYLYELCYPHFCGTVGFPMYYNHVLDETSWCHPVKLAELQEAGLVYPALSTAPFVPDTFWDEPVSAPWVVKYDRKGQPCYTNTGTDEAVERHPKALELGRARGSRELERRPLSCSGGPAEEAWLLQGRLPPWMDKIESFPTGSNATPLYINYRADRWKAHDHVKFFLEEGRYISEERAREMEKTPIGRHKLRYYTVLDADALAARAAVKLAKQKAKVLDPSRAEIMHCLD
ncbi:hypothetical protein RB597_005856 [Gaeumannomyces tritici]